jgi:hypothetical protein
MRDNSDIKALAEKLRIMGGENSPDDILAHITPKEAALLKWLGGSGKIDARTGLPHFDDGEGTEGTGSDDDASNTGPEGPSDAPGYAPGSEPDATPADPGGSNPDTTNTNNNAPETTPDAPPSTATPDPDSTYDTVSPAYSNGRGNNPYGAGSRNAVGEFYGVDTPQEMATQMAAGAREGDSKTQMNSNDVGNLLNTYSNEKANDVTNVDITQALMDTARTPLEYLTSPLASLNINPTLWDAASIGLSATVPGWAALQALDNTGGKLAMGKDDPTFSDYASLLTFAVPGKGVDAAIGKTALNTTGSLLDGNYGRAGANVGGLLGSLFGGVAAGPVGSQIGGRAGAYAGGVIGNSAANGQGVATSGDNYFTDGDGNSYYIPSSSQTTPAAASTSNTSNGASMTDILLGVGKRGFFR